MARLKDTIIEGNARVTGSLYTPSAMLTDLEVVNNLTVGGNINVDGYINDYFVIKTTDNEIMANDYSIFFIAFCELKNSANEAHAQQFNCGELYFKRNNSLKSPIHLHVEFADKYSPANACWCFTYGTARLNPLLKNGNYTTKGVIDYYPCTLSMSTDGTPPWYGGILFSSKNKFQKIQFSGFSGGFQPFGIQLGYYGSSLTAPDNTWLNPDTGEYNAATCPYTINFDNVFINDSNVVDMSQADMILSRLYMNDRLMMKNGGPINQILTGSGLVGRDTKVSGAADRYQPARWIFDSGNAPQDGDIVTIEVPVAGHDYGTYLSIDNGSTYHPIVTSGTGRLTTHFAVGEYITLVFRADGSAASMFYAEGQANTTRHTITGGVWAVINFYNTNTNTLLRTYRQDGTDANHEYPVVAVSSSTTSPAAFTLPSNDSYKDCYGIISQRTPTINPSTGFITVHGLKGTENVDYGEVLPENPTEGQIFFQLSEPYYELPIGGSTGQCLIKRSNTDRDVMWGTSVPNGGTTGQALIKASDADGDVNWGTVNVDDKVSKSGDTMTGHLILQGAPGGIPAIRCTFPFLTRGVAPSQTYYSTHVWLDSNNNRLAQIEYTKATNASNFNFGLLADTTDGNHWGGLLVTAALNNSNANWVTLNANAGTITGAVWNDYAEMRAVPLPKNITPGSCVYEIGDDTMAPTYQRLQKGCKIVSDTFGFNIGETDTAKTPIAVAGRALVYLLEGREAARNAIGEFVCSGPNGTVSIMTTEEYLQNPQAVVGTISAVPDYEEWGSTNVKVNGRIWIYVR